MEEMIRQIRMASEAGLYYLTLFGALTLPDICAALASDNGKTTGAKYKEWLKANVPSEANDAELIYGLRCSLLHQGSALPHGNSFPIAFMHPSPGVGQLHNLSTIVEGQQIGWVSIPIFVQEMTDGAESWFAKFGSTATVVRNFEKFARIRPDGVPGVVRGPVIA